MVFSHPGDWREVREACAAAQREENKRVANLYSKLARDREERDAAEARAVQGTCAVR
jgi:hypothetical protein